MTGSDTDRRWSARSDAQGSRSARSGSAAGRSAARSGSRAKPTAGATSTTTSPSARSGARSSSACASSIPPTSTAPATARPCSVGALAGHRSEVVVSTKFGYTFDPETKQASGTNASAAYVRAACEASLRRLGTDYIDLYQLHIWSLPQEEAEEAAGALENRRREGKIRAYGWSTDDLDCARLFATRPGCSAIEHDLNVLDDAPELIQLCEQNG